MAHKMTKWILAGVVAAAAGAVQAQDFDGMYGGVVVRNNFNTPGNVDVGVGAFAGYNMEVSNGIVAGVEAEIDYDPIWPSPPFGGSAWTPGGSDVTATANVRVGADVGGALVFGKAGAGYSTIGDWVWGVGGGVDVPVMDKMFVRGEFQRLAPVTAPVAPRYSAKVGVGYNF